MKNNFRLIFYELMLSISMCSINFWNTDWEFKSLRLESTNSFTENLNDVISSENYSVYLPIIMNQIIEVDYDNGCRWQYNSGQTFIIEYKWINELAANPYHPWRSAFENGLGAWNVAPTHFLFLYASDAVNTIEVVNKPGIGSAGKTILTYYSPNIYCDHFEMWANLAYDNYSFQEMRQTIAAHEVGHGHGVGHIPRDIYHQLALMWNDGFSDGELMSILVPQMIDIDFVNQFYP